ncbi:formate dehydrogenase subunit gamma [Kaistia algarum]|uniref:formate dehydrogenase subunit gamma n=1 Tax=Kaistia algarum TaxID=2083279 RepID=UPI000CE7562B|nr:formate dehydrogenase subunit gamma [Kaistia algarum]MCX5513069.1 formate dehydrogenase subunit gamma [Kaistia algarum]PPE81453.1 formate dehydrogenase subunit gamma [Kaistia algarum]
MLDMAQRVGEIVDRHAGREGSALPILHDIQAAFGYVPSEAVPIVAHALNRSRAEIHGVVTFYHDFRSTPAGRHVVRVCKAEACKSMGSHAIVAAFEAALGQKIGTTSEDGEVTLEPVYCLGLCATAPNAMIDGKPAGRLDPVAVERLVAEIER